jgi:hypothetical protein
MDDLLKKTPLFLPFEIAFMLFDITNNIDVWSFFTAT